MHYAGKKGFTSIANMRPAGKTINLWQLSELADKLTAEKKAEKAGEKVIVDLKQLGFSKLLGTGSISRAVQVKVDKCSEGARKKIERTPAEKRSSELNLLQLPPLSDVEWSVSSNFSSL